MYGERQRVRARPRTQCTCCVLSPLLHGLLCQAQGDHKSRGEHPGPKGGDQHRHPCIRAAQGIRSEAPRAMRTGRKETAAGSQLSRAQDGTTGSALEELSGSEAQPWMWSSSQGASAEIPTAVSPKSHALSVTVSLKRRLPTACGRSTS